MLPVLQLGPFAIQTYPLVIVLGGWAALAIGAHAARHLDLAGDDIYNAGLYALVGGVLAARFAHVIAYWSAYRGQPLEIVALNTTAFLLWPGALAALAIAGWYIYRRRLPLAAMLDAFAPGLLVGLAIMALGALLVGRNPGAPAALPWSVNLWGLRRHPVQIYEAIGLFAVGLFVLSAIRTGSRRGVPALLALLGWGLVTWLVGAFRSPEVSAAVLGGLRLEQVIGLVAALAALAGLRYLATRSQDQPPLAP